MKKAILLFCFIFLLFSFSAAAQERDEEKPVSIDVLLERDALDNLKIAWHYFKLRKAYNAVLVRMEETMAAHPTFTKADEVLYLLGMSSYYLAEGKGKQKIDLSQIREEDRDKYTPEKLREAARAYLGTLVEEYPESKYAKKAKKTLKKIKPAK